MPRMLANEFVYSTATTDERYNEYLTPTTSPLDLYRQQQQPISTTVQSTVLCQNKLSEDDLQSPPCSTSLFKRQERQTGNQPQSQANLNDVDEQESFDGGEKSISITNSDNDDEDFKGFDENYSKGSIGSDRIVSEKDAIYFPEKKSLKRQVDCEDYVEDSEGVVEAIEVDDDADIEEVDGQKLFRSKLEATPVKMNSGSAAACNRHTTSSKRRKGQSKDVIKDLVSQYESKTEPEPVQIVEINSDSTTISQKQKRHQINTRYQLNMNLRKNTLPNKCSTESTSEFPVSSPSNPQVPHGGGKYAQRPPLLKNTLPADSFERQLAIITACNPQMTLAEKIQSWCCEDEQSDIEDVNEFDTEFIRLEEQRKRYTRKLKNKKPGESPDIHYDFADFKEMILKNMNKQKNQRYLTGIGADGSSYVASGFTKKINSTTASDESSKSDRLKDERPSTSAVAQQQHYLRRSKFPNPNVESSDAKKRFSKASAKRNHNSTSPPATSSSENERNCLQNTKLYGPYTQFTKGGQKIQIHEKLLCPSSSDEANSQNDPLDENVNMPLVVRSDVQETSTQDAKNSKNLLCLAGEKTDSVFRLHRLSREIDKTFHEINYQIESLNHIRTPQPHEGGLIQVHLDFNKEVRKSNEKYCINNEEIFKTPILPSKSFSNNFGMTANALSPTGNISLPIKTNFATDQISEEYSKKTHGVMPPLTKIMKTYGKESVGMLTDNDGVYHQQHEFCNYLGLTGMSTATAMANAVAELAQCNLTRRSMRVLRQQQQERKDKSKKECKVIYMKTAKQRKREKGGHEIVFESDDSRQLNEEGTNSQASEPTQSLHSAKTLINNSIKTLMNKVHGTQNGFQTEPQIKILCHIETAKTELEKTPTECVENITKPFEKPLIISPKQGYNRKTDKSLFHVKEDLLAETINNSHLCDEVKKLEDILQPSLKDDGLEKIIKKGNEGRTKRKMFNKYPNDTEQPEETGNYRSNQRAETETPSKLSATSENINIAYQQSSAQLNSSPYSSYENITKDLSSEDEITDSSNEDQTDEWGENAQTPTSAAIKEKLQAALEESRKTKPSIFIVQSLECVKENTTKPVSIRQTQNEKNIKLRANTRLLKSFTTKKDINEKSMHDQEEQTAKTKAKKNNKNSKARRKSKRQSALREKNFSSKRELRSQKLISPKPSESEVSIKQADKPKKLRSQKSQIKAKRFKRTVSISKFQINTIPAISSPSDSLPNKPKNYRNAQTETNDLELCNNKIRTRLMAKATALLQRSRRMNITRGLRSKLLNNTTKTQNHQPQMSVEKANIDEPKKLDKKSSSPSTSTTLAPETVEVNVDVLPLETSILNVETNTDNHQHQELITTSSITPENENVVVSSTTNSFEERHHHINNHLSSSDVTYNNTPSSPLETKDIGTQVHNYNEPFIRYLSGTPSPTHIMLNPLKRDNGVVLYLYYEVDVLIVLQERLVSFWKCSRLLNALSSVIRAEQKQKHLVTNLNMISSQANSSVPVNADTMISNDSLHILSSSNDSQQRETATPLPSNPSPAVNSEWILLGQLSRLTYDSEVVTPYANRICLHNSTPIYLEMRARPLPKNNRDCTILSMYINIYFYHDEDMVAKTYSIQLDTVQSDVKLVNYTTIRDSRYFVMTWPQQNILGKVRSGLCKYSLTPQLDTLASIREFKSMRHAIRHLECVNDDKMIGIGETQLTIWDHRSGDVLMNFDLDIPLGRNLGSIYYASQEIEHNNMIILFQCRERTPDEPTELLVIACTVTHLHPSFRVLYQLALPTAFRNIKHAFNTGEHVIIIGSDKNERDSELWISCGNPTLVAQVPPPPGQDCNRYYNREKSQLIELSEQTLNIDTLANHNLILAATLATTTFNKIC